MSSSILMSTSFRTQEKKKKLLRTTSAPVLKKVNVCPLATQFEEDHVITPKKSQTHRPMLCLRRTSSEGDLKRLLLFKERSRIATMSPFVLKEKEVCRSMNNSLAIKAEEDEKMVFAGGGVGGGGGGRGICGGSGGGGDGWWSSGHGFNGGDIMDMYYQSMIKIYPADALLLSNYAKFLKEVRGDAVKAEEYCERALLLEADDANVLAMYGDLIWKNYKDCDRALSYFDQAILSSPDDCNVLASYAHFLWDAEGGEEEEEDEHNEIPFGNGQTCVLPENLLEAHPPPLTAAS